jgi:hypothetical protein
VVRTINHLPLLLKNGMTWHRLPTPQPPTDYCLLITEKSGSSVCVMQWTGVIRDETLIETDITAIFVNCLRSGAN